MRTHLLALALLAVFAATCAAATDEDDELYIAIRQERLFESAGLHGFAVAVDGHGLLGTGVRYQRSQGGVEDAPSVVLAVHGSVAAAQDAFRQFHAPTKADGGVNNSLPIGDERYLRIHASGYEVAFRRRNIFIRLLGETSLRDGLALMENIDRLVRDDREVAPLGRFAEQPRVAGLRLTNPDGEPLAEGAALDPDVTYDATLDIRGLGPRENLRISLAGGARAGAAICSNRKGRLTVRGSPGYTIAKVQVSTANEDNVVAAGDFTFPLIPAARVMRPADVPSGDEDEAFYTSLDQELLFERARLFRAPAEVKAALLERHACLTATGVQYDANFSTQNVTLAVHESVAAAKDMMRRMQHSFPLGPGRVPDLKLGHEHFAHQNGAGVIGFRRNNITVFLVVPRSKRRAKSIA